MNKVTLYQVTKSEHLTLANHLELRQFSYDDIIQIRGSDEFIPKQEVKHINIPIQKYVFSQKDWKGNVEERIVYASFDDELLELIQCERNKFQNLNDEIICRTAEVSDLKHEVVALNMYIGTLKADKMFFENECSQLKSENDKVRKMNFWERLVFLFKGSV